MRKYIMPLLIICLFTGFFLAYQFKVQSKSTSFEAISQRNNNLITIIQDLEKEIANQENQIDAMRTQLNDIQSQNNQESYRNFKQSSPEQNRSGSHSGYWQRTDYYP